MPPPPLKIASTLIKAIDTALTTAATDAAEHLLGRKIPQSRRQQSHLSGTLAGLRSNHPPALIRGNAGSQATRRPVGGNALIRAQSMQNTPRPTLAPTTTSVRQPPSARRQAPPLSGSRTPQASQSNSALQEALRQSTKQPDTAENEDAQLQMALEQSRADAFLQPTTRGEADAQLRKALRNSLAAPLMPAKPSHDPHEAQLEQAVALSKAEDFTPPANAKEEEAQIARATENSKRHTSGAHSPVIDEEDAQLQRALAESNADAFSPSTNPAHEKAHMDHAVALSEAEALEAEHAQLEEAIKQSLEGAPEHEHEAGSEKPKIDSHTQLQLDQLLMQAAIKKADARKALGEALKTLTANN